MNTLSYGTEHCSKRLGELALDDIAEIWFEGPIEDMKNLSITLYNTNGDYIELSLSGKEAISVHVATRWDQGVEIPIRAYASGTE